MVNRFLKFQLREREEDGVVLESGDFKSRVVDCERSLIGKIWGAKSANFSGLTTP